MSARRVEQCAYKIGLCVRNARRCSRDSWQHAENKKQAREFRAMSRESINGICGARWWAAELRKAWESVCTA